MAVTLTLKLSATQWAPCLANTLENDSSQLVGCLGRARAYVWASCRILWFCLPSWLLTQGLRCRRPCFFSTLRVPCPVPNRTATLRCPCSTTYHRQLSRLMARSSRYRVRVMNLVNRFRQYFATANLPRRRLVHVEGMTDLTPEDARPLSWVIFRQACPVVASPTLGYTGVSRSSNFAGGSPHGLFEQRSISEPPRLNMLLGQSWTLVLRSVVGLCSWPRVPRWSMPPKQWRTRGQR